MALVSFLPPAVLTECPLRLRGHHTQRLSENTQDVAISAASSGANINHFGAMAGEAILNKPGTSAIGLLAGLNMPSMGPSTAPFNSIRISKISREQKFYVREGCSKTSVSSKSCFQKYEFVSNPKIRSSNPTWLVFGGVLTQKDARHTKVSFKQNESVMQHAASTKPHCHKASSISSWRYIDTL